MPTNKKSNAKSRRGRIPKSENPVGNHVRTPGQIEFHRAVAAKMLTERKSVVDIALHLKISYAQARQDCDLIKKQWKESVQFNADELREDLLRQINLIQQMSFEAFHNSKTGKKRDFKRFGKAAKKAKKAGIKVGREAMKLLEKTETLESGVGDPAFLRLALECVGAAGRVAGIFYEPKDSSGIDPVPQSKEVQYIVMPAYLPPRPIPELKSANASENK